MATKFKPWIDSATNSNTQNASTFASDSQRINGFTANTPASSIRVNTALREATLVVAALMDIVDSAGTTDGQSTVSAVKTLLQAYFSSMGLPSYTVSDKNKVLAINANGTGLTWVTVGGIYPNANGVSF